MKVNELGMHSLHRQFPESRRSLQVCILAYYRLTRSVFWPTTGLQEGNLNSLGVLGSSDLNFCVRSTPSETPNQN